MSTHPSMPPIDKDNEDRPQKRHRITNIDHSKVERDSRETFNVMKSNIFHALQSSGSMNAKEPEKYLSKIFCNAPSVNNSKFSKKIAPRLSDYLAPGGTQKFSPRKEWLQPSPGERKRDHADEERIPSSIRKHSDDSEVSNGDTNILVDNDQLLENALINHISNTIIINECRSDELEVLEEFQETTQDPISNSSARLNSFGSDSDSALHVAIRERAIDAAMELIQLGSSVSAENAKRVTPLILAAQKGYVVIVKELLLNGANPLAVSLTGSTPLLQACHFGHLQVVQLLLRNGAMIEMANHKNTTPLMRASQEGHEDVVRLLLSYGAKVNRRNNENMSALMLASQRGHSNIVRLLLDAKADIDAMTMQQSTSLMLACKREHVNVAKALVSYGCELFIKDSRGCTAKSVAMRKNSQDLLSLLHPAKQVQLMQEKSRVERNYTMIRMYLLLQQERAFVLTSTGTTPIHQVHFVNERPIYYGSSCMVALIRTMMLPAPMVELIAAYLPLPRLWDARLRLLTKRCGVDADATVSCAMDLIDEVLEESGFLDACQRVGITPPTHFKSWEEWKGWGIKHDHVDPPSSREPGRLNALTATLPGLPRFQLGILDMTSTPSPMNSRELRRGICYLQLLAHCSPLLARSLAEPPFNMPTWLINQLITVNDIQSLSRRLGNKGVHFDATVAIEIVMLASSMISWYDQFANSPQFSHSYTKCFKPFTDPS
jgi:ankyrin repeat protein